MKHLHGDEACRGTQREGSFEGVCPDIVSAAVCLSLSLSVPHSVCLQSIRLLVCLCLFLSVSPFIPLCLCLLCKVAIASNAL